MQKIPIKTGSTPKEIAGIARLARGGTHHKPKARHALASRVLEGLFSFRFF